MRKRHGPRSSRQLDLAFRYRGGARRGAGRKPAGEKAGTPHTRRPEFKQRHPLHVTMKVRPGLPSLRQRPLAALVLSGFRAARQRLGARLVQYSIQSNHIHHIHLIVEAEGRYALSRAMRGLAVRLARRLNANIGRRGSVFADRFTPACSAHRSRSGERSSTCCRITDTMHAIIRPGKGPPFERALLRRLQPLHDSEARPRLSHLRIQHMAIEDRLASAWVACRIGSTVVVTASPRSDVHACTTASSSECGTRAEGFTSSDSSIDSVF
jgi:hypothetical protein